MKCATLLHATFTTKLTHPICLVRSFRSRFINNAPRFARRSAYHTIIVDEEEEKYAKPGDALKKGMGSKAKDNHEHTAKAITAEEQDSKHEKDKEKLQER